MIKPLGQFNQVVILGLDCAEPSLVFDRFKHLLPSINGIAESGSSFKLRSTDPPLTIPAWTSMMTGKDPGELGLYGIRNRVDYSYSDLSISTSSHIKFPRIWDILGKHDKTSIVVNVPQTYPVIPIKGWMITGMLTPNTQSDYTYPAHLKREIQNIESNYSIDIPDYRNIRPDQLVDWIHRMTISRFNVFRHLLTSRKWDFAMDVEIGLDRIQHCFWHYWDENHPLHETDNLFSDILPEYYRLLDVEIGKTIEILSEDTAVIIVSDHGAQPMMGGIRINQWLINNGYLKLKYFPDKPTPLKKDMIDWSGTAAWGEGGYFGRIFLNIEGREPHGTIPPDMSDSFLEKLTRELRQMLGPDGNSLNNRVFQAKDVYKQTNGIPPDIFVYFGNLSWRSLSEVGSNQIFTLSNDAGPDGANHAVDGIFISNFKLDVDSGINHLDISDIAPMILKIFNIEQVFYSDNQFNCNFINNSYH